MKTFFCGEESLQLARYEAPSIEVVGFSASGVLCMSPSNEEFNDNGRVDWFD